MHVHLLLSMHIHLLPMHVHLLLFVQALNTRQAAKHSAEVEELLLELSKQHAAAQAAQTLVTPQGPNPLTPQQPKLLTPLESATGPYGLAPSPKGMVTERGGEAGVRIGVTDRLNLGQDQGQPDGVEGVEGRSPTPPRLMTPTSPVRRPNR